MVSDPSPSRRAVLTAGVGLLGAAVGGRLAASRDAGTPVATPDAWPMARHDPGGTCYARGVTGPADEPSVTWRRSLSGSGLIAPTPVVADDTVYVSGRGLTAVDAADGTERFRHPESPPAAPAVADAAAYRTPTVVLPGGRPVGLHADGGPSLFGWRPLGTRWTAGPTDAPTFSFGATTPVPPVAAGNTVLADTGTVLAAIDASSGTVRWTADDVHRRPAVRDGTVYALGLESLYGFDLDSGARSTVATLDNGLRSVTATPDRIVVGTYEELVAVSYDGTIGWRYSPDGETELEEVAPAAADGVVYASFSTETDRQVVAVDAADGTRLWTAPVAVSQGGGRGAMAVGDERLYVPTQDDGIAALDRADGRERWRYTWDTVGPVSPPALVDGRLYAVVAGTLYALEAP